MSGILFLAHRLPFPPDRGDKIRSHNVLKALAALGRTTGGWTGANLSGAVIRATHLQQIRDRVK